MKNSLQPVSNENCRILILGSLPGNVSLEKQEYYAFPRNLFWKILSEVLGADIPINYSDKINMLLKNNIALWDVIESANRDGSLDSDIKNENPNDLSGFLDTHQKIDRILFNGSKSFASFNKHFKNIEIKTYSLPSTSPANASIKYIDKLEKWETAIKE